MILKNFLNLKVYLLCFIVFLNFISSNSKKIINIVDDKNFEKLLPNKIYNYDEFEGNQDENTKNLRKNLIDEDLNGSLSLEQLDEFINTKDFNEDEGYDIHDEGEFILNFQNEESLVENENKNKIKNQEL